MRKVVPPVQELSGGVNRLRDTFPLGEGKCGHSGPCDGLVPPQRLSWCPRRHPPGQEVSKADLPPLRVQCEGPASPPAPPPCRSSPPPQPHPPPLAESSGDAVAAIRAWTPLASAMRLPPGISDGTPSPPWHIPRAASSPGLAASAPPRLAARACPAFCYFGVCPPQITARDSIGANCWPGPSPAGASSAPQALLEELGAAAQGTAGDLGPPFVPCRAGTAWGWGHLGLGSLAAGCLVQARRTSVRAAGWGAIWKLWWLP